LFNCIIEYIIKINALNFEPISQSANRPILTATGGHPIIFSSRPSIFPTFPSLASLA